ncbi:hypothetical protein KCP77_10295 [Salmonella enterica subsp. enterica]|nr:hypothetical protein KCP77_10295 [Salmonella enterica subsp. enterica]
MAARALRRRWAVWASAAKSLVAASVYNLLHHRRKWRVSAWRAGMKARHFSSRQAGGRSLHLAALRQVMVQLPA